MTNHAQLHTLGGGEDPEHAHQGLQDQDGAPQLCHPADLRKHGPGEFLPHSTILFRGAAAARQAINEGKADAASLLRGEEGERGERGGI